MLKNYLLITWRSMMKNELFLCINILGMAVGIGCCVVAYFNWEFDRNFDKNHTNAEKIYRVGSVRQFNNQRTMYGFAPIPLGAIVRENFGDVEKAMRYSWSNSNFKVEDDIFWANLAYVDHTLPEIFTFEFIHGDGSALKDKSKVVLNEEMAMRLFGSLDVVGRQITQVMGPRQKEIEVGAVFKNQPSNSSIQAQAFMLYDNFFDEATTVKEDDWRNRNSLFIMVDEPSRLNAIYDQLQPFRENNNRVREDFQISEFILDPFVGMAQRDEANDTWTQLSTANPRVAVVAPALMAVLLLFIACFNMTNTAIAISSRRLKEIGIRKVMGSVKAQLVFQFIGETALVCFLSLLIGLVFGEILLHAWNSLWPEMTLESHYLDNPGFVIFVIGVLAFTALLAGSYPAFYISGFEPVSILKGKLKFGRTNFFTRFLLGVQYAISLLAIVFAIAFYSNSVYQRDFDIGFKGDGVIIAYVDNQGEFETYRNAVLQNKDVEMVAGSQHSIYSSRYNDPVKHESKQIEVDIIDVGDDYLDVMGIELLAGRDFIKDSETDRRESVIVTKGFADQFGWADPIGKEVMWNDTVRLYVVGMIKDVYTRGLWGPKDPMMIRYTSPEKYSHVIVRAPVAKLTDVNRFMEAQWKQVFPNRMYNGRILQEGMAEAATVNSNILKMFVFLGAVALILSGTGLFALVSLNIIRKMKEIGVRKVLGASVSNITRIINTEFVIILAIAALCGAALAWFAVDAMMGSIWTYYQAATLSTCIVSIGLMFVVSGVSIAYKVFTAASMNPVNTLRTE